MDCWTLTNQKRGNAAAPYRLAALRGEDTPPPSPDYPIFSAGSLLYAEAKRGVSLE